MVARNIGKLETLLGVIILALLSVIAVVVLKMGLQGLPDEYFLPTELTDQQQATSGPAIWALLPKQLKSDDGAEFRLAQQEYFSAEDLWKKINGQDVNFLSLNVLGLYFAGYISNQSSEMLFLDVYIYDMTAAENALGIYQGHSSNEHKTVNLGQMGYIGQGSAGFFKDRYYVQIRGEQAGATGQKLLERLAGQLAGTLPGSKVTFWPEKMFPPDGKLADTLTFEKNSALGLDFLTDIFLASYQAPQTPSEQYQLFVGRYKTPDLAKEVLEQYVKHLSSYGQLLEGREISGVQVVLAQIDGQLEAIFTSGRYLGGLTEGPAVDQALKGPVIRTLGGLVSNLANLSKADSGSLLNSNRD